MPKQLRFAALVEPRVKISFFSSGCPTIESQPPLRTYLCCDDTGSGSGSGGTGLPNCEEICGATFNGEAMTEGDLSCANESVASRHSDAQAIWHHEDNGTVNYLFAVPNSECTGGYDIYTAECITSWDEENHGCCDAVWSDNGDGTYTLTTDARYQVEDCSGEASPCEGCTNPEGFFSEYIVDDPSPDDGTGGCNCSALSTLANRTLTRVGLGDCIAEGPEFEMCGESGSFWEMAWEEQSSHWRLTFILGTTGEIARYHLSGAQDCRVTMTFYFISSDDVYCQNWPATLNVNRST